MSLAALYEVIMYLSTTGVPVDSIVPDKIV